MVTYTFKERKDTGRNGRPIKKGTKRERKKEITYKPERESKKNEKKEKRNKQDSTCH